MTIFEKRGLIFSLENNFNASAKGWAIPIVNALLGPFRDWLNPKIFRSNNVIKATLINIGIIIIKKCLKI